MSTSLFKLDENTKTLITEVSALSGYAQSIVKECYDYLLIDWAVKLAEAEGKPATLTIPFLGKIKVEYTGDKVTDTGELETEASANVEMFPAFLKLIGDIQDEGYTELVPFISKKIENAVMIASSD